MDDGHLAILGWFLDLITKLQVATSIIIALLAFASTYAALMYPQ